VSPFPIDAVVLVDVYLLRLSPSGLEVLLLRRAEGGRSPGSWEGVHGHLRPGESAHRAAWREVVEETGIRPDRLYNLSRMEQFYLHRANRVALVPAFAGLVTEPPPVTLSHEHDLAEWLPLEAAMQRVGWPRIRRALADARDLLSTGDAGLLEDALLVEEPA
jgi:8-oxo-dGTP pyrophosphatase MutT (NUDIX family)